LQARLSRMASALRPLFVTVTWGAGGSTAGRSLELAEICQRQLGLTTCLHLTCTNMNKKIVDEALNTAKDLGIRNILALRGDPPRGHEYEIDGFEFEGSEQFVWASDLVRYIRQEHGDYFCIGVAGYPEGHSDESNPAHQDPKHDMPYLLEKVQAGSDFIITQLFYNEDAYLSYEKLVREWDNGAMRDVIIIPALMPIQSYSILKRTTFLSHSKVPIEILEQLERVKTDDEEVKRIGVEVISSIIEKIKTVPSLQHRGFHFFPLNLEKAVSYILEKTKLLTPIEDEDTELNSAVVDSELTVNDAQRRARRSSARRGSSPHNHINYETRSTSSLEPPSRATTLAISHGIGSLGREATWDDYPNGRFGDARSPAFGEIDGYGTSLHLSPAAARLKWGAPTSRSDISTLFLKHLRGELDQLPWSEGPLNAETRLIQSQLCALIEKRGWWSIASQPAADGVSSSDPVFGWGPKGGFVFQKAFVEFWVPAADWHNILKPYLQSPAIASRVSWYAATNPQATNTSFTSTLPGSSQNNNNIPKDASIFFESSSSSSAVDSVTWGVFPGKEIVTPTIIEEMSFRAWVDEAFGIWREWERCYPPESVSRKVIRECRQDYWLVNIIGQAFQDRDGLWEVLLAA
jgi:methylenetetrahydrofolate reductase (NADPH)